MIKVTLPDGSVREYPKGTTSMQVALSISEGLAPNVLSAHSGALPAGLTLSTAGVISGTPTSTTSASFTIRSTDNNGGQSTRRYILAPVCGTVTVNPTSLPSGTVGTAYSQTLTASGTLAPYTWTVSSGTLPVGLTLNSSTGVISGTPTASASPATSITVRVNDTYGCQGTQVITLQIFPVITVNPTSLAASTVGTAYSQIITATGGTTPLAETTVFPYR